MSSMSLDAPKCTAERGLVPRVPFTRKSRRCSDRLPGGRRAWLSRSGRQDCSDRSGGTGISRGPAGRGGGLHGAPVLPRLPTVGIVSAAFAFRLGGIRGGRDVIELLARNWWALALR